jgi:hypothetical protein
MIKLAQDRSATAWAEPDLHNHAVFIKPSELDAHLARAALYRGGRVGFPAKNPPAS